MPHSGCSRSLFFPVMDQATLIKEIHEYADKQKTLETKLAAAEDLEEENRELNRRLERECEEKERALAQREATMKEKEETIRKAEDGKLAHAIQRFKCSSENLDDKGCPIAKKNRPEFDIDGSKLVPTTYTCMNLEGLLNIGTVDPRCH